MWLKKLNIKKVANYFIPTRTYLKYNEYPRIKLRKRIPDGIDTPSYYLTGLVEKTVNVDINNKDALNKHIKAMKQVCEFASYIRDSSRDHIIAGATTEDIDRLVHNECIKNNYYPAPLDYKGFPKSAVISVNEVACHGIPDTRPLQDGDLVKLDVSVYRNGVFGDCCTTKIIGEVPLNLGQLVYTAQKCVKDAIKICGPGVKFNMIGNTISKIVERTKFNIIKEYSGHGIGTNMHCPPNILHYENEYDQGVMKPGMIFTIEPILTDGNPEVEIWEDKWSVITKDKSMSAQFEETIMITENGAELLTTGDLLHHGPFAD